MRVSCRHWSAKIGAVFLFKKGGQRWRKGEEERERIKLERLRKEEEARYKDFDEKLEEWKSGEINFLNTPLYIPGEKPNAWIRIKGNIIETSKQIKIGIAEARKLWRAVSAMHRGAEFRHGLVHCRSPVESKSVRKRFANRWMS